MNCHGLAVAGACHGRLDGKGYPAEMAILLSLWKPALLPHVISSLPLPLIVLIVAISVEMALQIMEKLRGRSLDEDCLDALL